MTRTENTKLRIVLTILLGAAAVISYYFILGWVQHESLIDVIRKEMEETAAGVKKAYPNTDAAFLDITTSMDFVYEGDLDLVAYFARKDEGFKISDSWLKDYNFGGDYGDLIIADRDGSILASASGDHSDIPDEIRDSLLETYKTGEFASYKPDVQVPAKNPDEEQEELSLSSDDYTVWYAKKLDEDHALILKVKDLVQMAILYNTDAWSALLSNKPVGADGFVFVWSDDTKKILYYPETRMKYHSIDELGVDPDKIGDGEFGWHDVNGKKMFLYTTLDPETGVWIACAVPERELENSNRFTIGMFCIAFALLVAAFVYYVILLLLQKRVKVIRDFTGGVKESAHKSRQYKLLILTIVMLVILFLFQFYLQTLYLMSSWAESASAQTDRIEKAVSIQEQTAKVRAGEDVLVAFYIDRSDRCAATMKVYPYLSTDAPYIPGQTVTGRVYQMDGIHGAYVAVDDRYSGRIPARELTKDLHVGDVLSLHVTAVKEDGKLDLSVRDKAYLMMDEDAEAVLQVIRDDFGGELPFDDKADPEKIREVFGLSKASFKRAVGRLYKERRIELAGGKITVCQ